MVKETTKKLIVVLESATLEVVAIKKGYELLTGDEHMHLMKKLKKDPADVRPDICHQCLLMLFDSPLNKAGLLEVYLKTQKNVLIKINPQTRIPRTYKRFAGLMVQLLHEFKIESVAKEGNQVLLQVIKNPIFAHLPVGAPRIGTSSKGQLVKLNDFVKDLNPNGPVVFVIGSMAQGEIPMDYVEQTVSISNFPLSGAVVCSRVCQAFEDLWDIR
uniref:Ribosomal RNA small subunit methyltransferase NEP1 n=1 Tax=Arcella intermedia TaxID=1963864 RepID=A0A6B2LGZ5_9EUKA